MNRVPSTSFLEAWVQVQNLAITWLIHRWLKLLSQCGGGKTNVLLSNVLNSAITLKWVCGANWTLPFEIHIHSVEEFGIPTKINVLSDFRSTHLSKIPGSRSTKQNKTKQNKTKQNKTKQKQTNKLWEKGLKKHLTGFSAEIRQKRDTFRGIQLERHLIDIKIFHNISAGILNWAGSCFLLNLILVQLKFPHSCLSSTGVCGIQME